MGKKRDYIRHCAHIRGLIDEKQYIAALEEVDRITLTEVPAIEDLYLFAELYEKAGRMDKKREILHIIYERTHSKHTLYELIRLLIRMGNLEEAGELFLAYEVMAGVTLNTFELRYRLAQAQGEPVKHLIEILEELKKEEYTEEWGYQLALLYEISGDRKKCIQECSDLKLWFGEGKIINRAMELKMRCEDSDWTPPAYDELPEPPEPDLTEPGPDATPASQNPQDSDTRAKKRLSDTNTELDEILAQTGSLPKVQMEVDETSADPKITLKPKPVPAPEQMEVVTHTTGKIPKIEEALSKKLEDIAIETAPDPIDIENDTAASSETSPVKSALRKPEPPIPEEKNEEEEPLEEDTENISQNGVAYRTLKSTIRHMKHNKNNTEAHFVFAGGEEKLTLAIAKRIVKQLNAVGYFNTQKIAKIEAEKLNGLNLMEREEELRNGCLLIIGAPALSGDAVNAIISLIEKNRHGIVVMLSGPFDEMDSFLSFHPGLEAKMSYKIKM